VEEAHRHEKKERENKRKAAVKLKEAQERAYMTNRKYHGIVEEQVPVSRTGKVWL